MDGAEFRIRVKHDLPHFSGFIGSSKEIPLYPTDYPAIYESFSIKSFRLSPISRIGFEFDSNGIATHMNYNFFRLRKLKPVQTLRFKFTLVGVLSILILGFILLLYYL